MVAIRLRVPAQRKETELVRFRLAWNTPPDGGRRTFYTSLWLPALPGAEVDQLPADANVERQFALFQSARARLEAIRFIDRGDAREAHDVPSMAYLHLGPVYACRKEVSMLRNLQEDLEPGRITTARKKAVYQRFQHQYSREECSRAWAVGASASRGSFAEILGSKVALISCWEPPSNPGCRQGESACGLPMLRWTTQKACAPFRLPDVDVSQGPRFGESPAGPENRFAVDASARLSRLFRAASSRTVPGVVRLQILPGLVGARLGTPRLRLDNAVSNDPAGIAVGELRKLALDSGSEPIKPSGVGRRHRSD